MGGTLTSQNIESELSYAYVHAVASMTGASIRPGSRHEDNAGIDAGITAWGPFPEGGFRTEVDLNLQLKATTHSPTRTEKGLGFELQGIRRYDELRASTLSIPRILVVLFLPREQQHWLEVGPDFLKLQRCAYWVSLRGAAETQNKSTVTVYLPPEQIFDPEGLRRIFARLSKKEELNHDCSH